MTAAAQPSLRLYRCSPKCHPESSSQVSKNKPQTYVQSTDQKHQNISMRTQQTSQILEMHPWYPFFASREGFGWRPFDIFKVCGLRASGRKHGTRHTVTSGFNKHDKYKGYPLVNTQKTIENPLYSWVNQLFLWPFSVAMLVYQRVSHQQTWGLHCNLTLQNEDLISRRLDRRCLFLFQKLWAENSCHLVGPMFLSHNLSTFEGDQEPRIWWPQRNIDKNDTYVAGWPQLVYVREVALLGHLLWKLYIFESRRWFHKLQNHEPYVYHLHTSYKTNTQNSWPHNVQHNWVVQLTQLAFLMIKPCPIRKLSNSWKPIYRYGSLEIIIYFPLIHHKIPTFRKIPSWLWLT